MACVPEYKRIGRTRRRQRTGSDRKGPWFNAKGVEVAKNVEDLHGPNNKLSKENSLSEKGQVLNGRGDTPNEHES